MPAPLTQPELAGLYDAGVDARRPHKRARQTSREVYRRQRSVDQARAAAGKETRLAAVLRVLAAYWNRFQSSVTGYELLRYGQEHGESWLDVNSVRPKLTRLFQCGLIEPRAPRRCRVTGKLVRTWAVREIGSLETR